MFSQASVILSHWGVTPNALWDRSHCNRGGGPVQVLGGGGGCLLQGLRGFERQLSFHRISFLLFRVNQFGWNYTFSRGNFPISTELCDCLSLPNVSQTCKLVVKTHSLALKDTTNYYLRIKNQIHALSPVPFVSHFPLIVKCATAHALCIRPN